MAKKRVVITGVGVIASNGIGKEAFSSALFKGVSGIKPISLFDSAPFKVKSAGEISDFSAEEFLGAKGLRTLDRSTKLAASGAKLALDDAGLAITEENSRLTGVVMGTTLGSLRSICDFDREAMLEGPHYVNPALFPNTVINSPASQVSIKLNIKGFNATISTGFCAGIDAVGYALDFLRLGRVRTVLAGAVEELCLQTFLGFYKTGCLAGLEAGKLEISCPFDKRRNGVIFGEGSSVLVLEDLEYALSRKARIYCELCAFGSSFDAYAINEYNAQGEGLRRAMRMAIEEAGLSPAQVDYICAAANSGIQADKIESWAIRGVFGDCADKVYTSSVKSMLGECYSASGSLQLAAGVCAIEQQMIPPTINYQEKDPECNLNYVTEGPLSTKVDNVLINAFGPSGCNSSLLISRFRG